MPAATRIGDADVAHCSGMTRAEGSPNVYVNTIKWSRQGDNNTTHLVPGSPCPPHAAPIATGSTTVSGIMSYKSGDKLNMKSAATMTIKSESTTDWTSAGLVTETFQASHTNNTTGTFDLNVSTEVDIDSALINLN